LCLIFQIWKKFFTFEHPIAEVPEVITDNFGEPYFPPPRMKQDPLPNSRRSKGKKWSKKKEKKRVERAMKERAALMDGQDGENADGASKESEAVEKVTDGKLDDDASKATEMMECVDGGNNKSCDPDVANIDLDKGSKDTADEKSKRGVDNSLKNTNNIDTVESVDESESGVKKPRVRENPWNPLMPSFRVTCNRHGEGHNFDSMTAAANFGGAVYQYFGWNVKMTGFDMEVIGVRISFMADLLLFVVSFLACI